MPKCGENLLTEEDHALFAKYLKIIDKINKYFSWLTIFTFWKKEEPVREEVHRLHFHEGVKIESWRRMNGKHFPDSAKLNKQLILKNRDLSRNIANRNTQYCTL